MKKRVKTSNTSTSTKQVTKKEIPLFDEYFDHFSWRMKPVSGAYLEHLGRELVEWCMADKEDLKKQALSIHKFFSRKGIGGNDIRRWRDRSPEFNSSYQFALKEIGERRVYGAMIKEFDSNMVRLGMPQYEHKELNWTEAEEWRSKLRTAQDENLSGGTKIVVIEKYPSSDLVPEKEKDE